MQHQGSEQLEWTQTCAEGDTCHSQGDQLVFVAVEVPEHLEVLPVLRVYDETVEGLADVSHNSCLVGPELPCECGQVCDQGWPGF